MLPRLQRVLVLQDDPDRDTSGNCGSNCGGFAVQEAENVRGDRQDFSFAPHDVLMNIWMPRLDGIGATRREKEDPDTRDIPVLALSADAYPPRRRMRCGRAATPFLEKPAHLMRCSTPSAGR